MSDEQPVSRREFDLYKDLAREIRDSDRAETARVAREVELVERNAGANLEALSKDTAGKFAAVALQREQDLTAAREQRQEDLEAEAKRRREERAKAEHRREWSWQTKFTVAALAVAMAGLYFQQLHR